MEARRIRKRDEDTQKESEEVMTDTQGFIIIGLLAYIAGCLTAIANAVQ